MNCVTTADECVHTTNTTQLDLVVGKFVQTRRDCRPIVANVNTPPTRLNSASAVCIGHVAIIVCVDFMFSETCLNAGSVDVGIYPLPKSGQAHFLWSNNDVRTQNRLYSTMNIKVLYLPKNCYEYISGKPISGYAPGLSVERFSS